MATSITINLSDEDEAVLAKLTVEINNAVAGQPPATATPAQVFRHGVREWLRSHASRFAEREQISLRAAYRKATASEQAAIDGILAPHRT